MLICVICVTSCCTDDAEKVYPASPEKVSSNSAGNFIVVNTRTNDSLTVKGESESDGGEITAHIGDTLKIIFNPENYKDYSFETKYTLPNNKTEKGKEGDLEYRYIVTSLKKGKYSIDLNASSSGATDDKIWDLTASGKFNLNIVSYANLDYQLYCSSALLTYATPQIIHTGNNGNSVTFTIPESEWEEDDSDDMMEPTIIMIDGDTIVSESKMMRWTKHIEYDDFSVIDDEMTVVYIPKDNVPMGNVDNTEGLKPILSANLEFVDDDGSKHKPRIIDIDISIGSSSGSPLSDIISNYRNYKGFHVESNGTYNTKKK